MLKDNYNTNRELLRNDNASLHNIGDGVLCFEFHSKGNTLDPQIYELGIAALDLLEDNAAFRAMVIGSQAKDFCLGANIRVFLHVIERANGDLKTLESAVHGLQEWLMRVRFAHKPVVTAPYGRALGGGAEVAMAGCCAVASHTAKIGLVELGVGVIPGGGGCKELLRRCVSAHAAGLGDGLPQLLQVFETIVQRRVGADAAECETLGFLQRNHGDVFVSDTVTDTATDADIGASDLLAEAKRRAISLAQHGYAPPNRAARNIWALGQRGQATLHKTIEQKLANRAAPEQFTDYDAEIAHELALVLCGGATPTPRWVSEDEILQLERAAFARLLAQPKTQARIAQMLQAGKPLRN
jgi:3-hydroxyacyl-CoA dehydrogenase